MPTKITMPQLGETVAEGIIGRWLKREGEWVSRDESLVEVVTDKVNAEIPCPVAGTLSKIVAREGTTVQVGEEIALIEEKAPAAAEAASQPASLIGAAKSEHLLARAPDRPGHLEDREDGFMARSSPVVRRLAAEHGLDLSQIQGTGQGGRITREDVLKYIAERPEPRAPVPSAPLEPAGQPPAPRVGAEQPKSQPPESAPLADTEEALSLSPMRRMIAEHMVRSKTIAPHVSTCFEVDMTKIVRYREAIKEDFRRRERVDLTYLPFVIRAVVESLKNYPILNSSWGDDKIVLKKEINVGVAVALDSGLIVPVIRHADEKSIAGLARALDDLVGRARAGKLTLADVQGGTFTVNNTGAFGSIISTPIINQPQAAIMTMEAIVKRPVVVNDAIAIHSMMNICLTFDHRITDGLDAGRFMQSVKRRLEEFDPKAMW